MISTTKTAAEQTAEQKPTEEDLDGLKELPKTGRSG
jgi:hypothetical protein